MNGPPSRSLLNPKLVGEKKTNMQVREMYEREGRMKECVCNDLRRAEEHTHSKSFMQGGKKYTEQ